ncbi:hypothetical protein FEM48_Zijuj08G0170800 [Ziziphus jujuba var. spinosa]|uniref:Cytochrome P450 CYP736A12-like n=1 Tax=Ziziphus jujuba var. spinosa TaxID=714518 RepID=A0A978V0B3_ZIZJJ|nr:hypothetical protein FEM48_Zijuj08G0170800 [Ziziphus jujuba var. spinosa]
MAWIWTILALLLLAYILLWKRTNNNNKRLPPGPRGFPIFGSLHLLGEFPHRDLHRLAKQYGPIMHIRLGLIPTIVVSSPKAAELFLKTHDLVFASRPPHEAAKHISYNQKSMAFAEYGSYWRDVRKMCTLELLSNVKINSFRAMRKEEVGLFIDSLRKSARDRVAVDLSAKVSSLSADMSCRMVFGKKFADSEFDERGFKAVIQEGMQLSAAPNLGDYIPPIASLDLQGLTKKMKKVGKVFDDFFEKIIDEHAQSKDEDKNKDFVDVMLGFLGSEESEYRIERSNIKAIILNAFGPTQSHLVQLAFTPISGVFGPYSSKVNFNSGRVPCQFHSPNFAGSYLPPGNCGDSMVGFQGGIDYVNQQGIRQVSPTGLGSSNVNCALPMMLGSSEHPNSTVNSAVNSGISVSPTLAATSVGQLGSTLMSGEKLQIHSTSSAGHVIHNNDSILTSPAT